jgi:glyceraldehyde-3-phosphate dehydrogenase (NADP+)
VPGWYTAVVQPSTTRFSTRRPVPRRLEHAHLPDRAVRPGDPILPYDDEQEVIDWVKASPFGQQASLFGSDPHRLSRCIDSLVNQVCRSTSTRQCQRGPDTFPFVGRKDSAENTLSVSDALRVFSIRSLVAA